MIAVFLNTVRANSFKSESCLLVTSNYNAREIFGCNEAMVLSFKSMEVISLQTLIKSCPSK